MTKIKKIKKFHRQNMKFLMIFMEQVIQEMEKILFYFLMI